MRQTTDIEPTPASPRRQTAISQRRESAGFYPNPDRKSVVKRITTEGYAPSSDRHTAWVHNNDATEPLSGARRNSKNNDLRMYWLAASTSAVVLLIIVIWKMVS